ncbi:inositol monophosphatase [Klebsiella pneumoniae]|uniref:Inositol monophosphatase n=1 Tax=Klebsiella pneumoniae TaxID=573 RepID=A0A378FQH5_KLEPN|nr:inositol monophosphatase [Klebsiella pneumoniae]
MAPPLYPRMDYWCISLARVCQGELSLGIIYAPDRDEFFFAARGEGAYLNGRRLTLREPEPDAVVIGMGRSSRPRPATTPGPSTRCSTPVWSIAVLARAP